MKLSTGIPFGLTLLSFSAISFAGDSLHVDKEGNLTVDLVANEGHQTLSLFSTNITNQIGYFLEHNDGTERGGLVDDVSGDISVWSKNARDTMVFNDLTLHGNVAINSAGGSDAVIINNTIVAGDFIARTLSGDDFVELNNTTIFGTTDIHTSDGHDDVYISGSTLEAQVSVFTGSGWDDVNVRHSNFVYYPPKFDGQSQVDTYEADGTNSFLAGDAQINNFESVSSVVHQPMVDSSAPDQSVNDTECVDNDGDGYGWNGRASCLLDNAVGSDNNDSSTDGAVCIDSDGDGYGWNGTSSCLIEDAVALDDVDNSMAIGGCIDSDGDGYGWNGFETCSVSPTEPQVPVVPEVPVVVVPQVPVVPEVPVVVVPQVPVVPEVPVVVVPQVPVVPEVPVVVVPQEPVLPEAPVVVVPEEPEGPAEPQPVVFMIGDTGPGGGIVFAISNGGTSGLEYAPSVIAGQVWGCVGTNVDPANRQSSGGFNVASGAASSDLLAGVISSGACDSPAARSAFDYGPGINPVVTSSDWYLPSTDELVAIRDSGIANVGLSGNPATRYWSATEDSDANAYLVLVRSLNNPLDTGAPSTSSKDTLANVLPVRSF